MNLICFSWEPWNLNVNTRSVPFVRALVRNKVVDRALYVSPPVSLLARLRGAKRQSLKHCWPRRSSGVIVFSPLYPLPQRCRSVNGWLGRCQLAILKMLFGLRPYFYLNTNPMNRELQPVFADAASGCLDMYDDFELVVSDDEIRRGEQARIREAVNADARRAGFVIAVNSLLADRFRQMGLRAEVLRNAVDLSLTDHKAKTDNSASATLGALPQPVIGYMAGQLDPRLDWELLVYLSQNRPTWSFVVLAPVRDPAMIPATIRSAANIHFVPAVPYPELLGTMSHFSVGIVPMRVNAMSLGNDLLKIYHYLAVGLPVVTTAVGGTAAFGDLIRLATSPDDFLEKLERALPDHSPETLRRRQEYARSNSWDARAAEFAALIEGCLPEQ